VLSPPPAPPLVPAAPPPVLPPAPPLAAPLVPPAAPPVPPKPALLSLPPEPPLATGVEPPLAIAVVPLLPGLLLEPELAPEELLGCGSGANAWSHAISAQLASATAHQMQILSLGDGIFLASSSRMQKQRRCRARLVAIPDFCRDDAVRAT